MSSRQVAAPVRQCRKDHLWAAPSSLAPTPRHLVDLLRVETVREGRIERVAGGASIEACCHQTQHGCERQRGNGVDHDDVWRRINPGEEGGGARRGLGPSTFGDEDFDGCVTAETVQAKQAGGSAVTRRGRTGQAGGDSSAL